MHSEKTGKRFLSLFMLCALLFLCAACFSSCSEGRKEKVRNALFVDCFDTVCTLCLPDDGSERVGRLTEIFEKELSTLDGLFNVYEEKAESKAGLFALNEQAGASPVKLDQRVFDLLLFAKEFSALTNGTVDPMIGALTILWKEASQREALPEEEALKEAGKHISPDCLILDAENGCAYISDVSARVDVGAFAKGFCARLLAQRLEDEGCFDYLISLGGNVCAHGIDPRTNEPWKVSVKDPKSEGAAVSAFSLKDASLVTSGSYERFFTFEGKTYHHIIDPLTLWPASRSDCVSVSVLHSDPALADALSTALFILPRKEGSALLTKTGGEALYISDSGEISRTESFPEKGGSDLADEAVLIALPCAFAAVLAFLLISRRGRKAEEAVGEADQTEKTVETEIKAETERDKRAKRKEPSNKLFQFKKRDVVLLCSLCVVALLLIPTLLLPKGGENAYAVVRIDGEKVCSLPLDTNAEFRAESARGSNLIVVKDGKVYVADADCRGKDCVRCGAIGKEDTAKVIACLPHRLTVTVETGGERG